VGTTYFQTNAGVTIIGSTPFLRDYPRLTVIKFANLQEVLIQASETSHIRGIMLIASYTNPGFEELYKLGLDVYRIPRIMRENSPDHPEDYRILTGDVSWKHRWWYGGRRVPANLIGVIEDMNGIRNDESLGVRNRQLREDSWDLLSAWHSLAQTGEEPEWHRWLVENKWIKDTCLHKEKEKAKNEE
jgi:hypothetical protein